MVSLPSPAAPLPVMKLSGSKGPETAFGCARDFLDNRLVYLVVSRAPAGSPSG